MVALNPVSSVVVVLLLRHTGVHASLEGLTCGKSRPVITGRNIPQVGMGGISIIT